MAYTYAQQLDLVQTAIAAILGGAQEYTINGRSYKHADLKTLFDIQASLVKLSNQQSSGRRSIAQF
jgi:hypothetical protein